VFICRGPLLHFRVLVLFACNDDVRFLVCDVMIEFHFVVSVCSVHLIVWTFVFVQFMFVVSLSKMIPSMDGNM
jgi:hypothetical protein